jgi:SDR family mycofactocin-dependent oxidoreductase
LHGASAGKKQKENVEMGRVEGKVIFITGAARGQGRAHALRLAEEGADIIGIDICADIASNGYPLATSADLEETAALVEKLGRRMVSATADVRDPAAVKAAVDAGVAELGRLDGVVAQAGICPLGNADPQAFLDVMNVCIGGVMNTVTAALPHLSDGASVVATGSLAALLSGSTDNPAMGAGGLGYSLAKRMIAQYVNDLAIVLAPRRIRVNGFHPGNTNTDMLHSDNMYKVFRPDLPAPARADAELTFPMMHAMPVGYIEVEDAANMVLFLMSDESRYVTGTQMRVDLGGYVKNKPQQSTF